MASKCTSVDAPVAFTISFPNTDDPKSLFFDILSNLPRNQWMLLPSPSEQKENLDNIEGLHDIVDLMGINNFMFLKILQHFGAVRKLTLNSDGSVKGVSYLDDKTAWNGLVPLNISHKIPFNYQNFNGTVNGKRKRMKCVMINDSASKNHTVKSLIDGQVKYQQMDQLSYIDAVISSNNLYSYLKDEENKIVGKDSMLLSSTGTQTQTTTPLLIHGSLLTILHKPPLIG